MRLSVTGRAIQQLASINKADSDRLFDKLEEYDEKPDLLEANLKIEQAGIYKDFSRHHRFRVGHFRVGDWRVIGLVDNNCFHVVGVIPRGELERELARIVRQYPLDLD
jgi:mRNA-degrading endonuclease RelE of RelBE toxin-antitoxin system